MEAAILTQHEDLRLLASLKEGTAQAMEMLFKKYFSRLCAFVMPYVKDENLAKDVVQEVFFRIWKNRAELNISSSFKSYLFMSAKNQALNQLRTAGRTDYFEEEHEEQFEWNEPAADARMEEKETRARIQAAIEKLPPKCRQVFSLSRFEGKSYKEIAALLDISPKTVENQVSKALYLLRGSLFTTLSVVWIIFLCFFKRG